jgi:molybdopterin synthase catalytic subunit
MFSLSTAPLVPADLHRELSRGKAGALVVFEGIVRELNKGRGVIQLDYEGDEAVAKNEFAKIVDEARAKFSILQVHGVHRVGNLKPGDLAVWLGVTAEHRGAAFDACEFLIDELKKRLPIWKKEHYVDGATEWIQSA